MRENLTKPKIGRKSTSKEEKAKRKKTQQKIKRPIKGDFPGLNCKRVTNK